MNDYEMSGPAAPSERHNAPVAAALHGGAQQARDRSAYDPRNQSRAPLTLVVVAGISTLIGLFLSIPAVILGVLAMASQAKAPARAASLTRWGWIAYAAGAVLMVSAGVALVVVAGYAASGSH